MTLICVHSVSCCLRQMTGKSKSVYAEQRNAHSNLVEPPSSSTFPDKRPRPTRSVVSRDPPRRSSWKTTAASRHAAARRQPLQSINNNISSRRRIRATVPHAKSTALYTQSCTSSAINSRRSVVHRRSHVPCTSAVGSSPPGAVNTRPTDVAVYVALADGRRAVAKFFKSRVWDKVPEGSAFIFRETLIFLKYSVAHRSSETYMQKFSSIYAADSIQYRRVTDTHPVRQTRRQLIPALA